MSRTLQYINLLGVLALSILCGVQWQINRRLNLETNRLEKTRGDQFRQIAEQEKSLKGCAADLDAFREQFRNAAKSLKDSEEKLHAAQREIAQLNLDRDQLKENVTRWSEAVTARDEQLLRARLQVQSLADDRNEAVSKFNGLAEKYNATVADLSSRTKDFNALVEKYNALAKAESGAK